MKKYILIACGFILFGIGMVMFAIPGIPSFPFLLAASILFAKSSPRFSKWIKGTRAYRENVADYLATRSLTRGAKIRILSISTAMIFVSIIIVHPLWVKFLLMLVLTVQYYFFIFHIATKEPAQIKAPDPIVDEV